MYRHWKIEHCNNNIANFKRYNMQILYFSWNWYMKVYTWGHSRFGVESGGHTPGGAPADKIFVNVLYIMNYRYNKWGQS